MYNLLVFSRALVEYISSDFDQGITVLGLISQNYDIAKLGRKVLIIRERGINKD